MIELGFLKPVDWPVEELLGRLSDKMAVAIRSAEYRGMLRRLLEETRQQADELRAQSDELRAANDELEAQSRSLQESQQRPGTSAGRARAEQFRAGSTDP